MSAYKAAFRSTQVDTIKVHSVRPTWQQLCVYKQHLGQTIFPTIEVYGPDVGVPETSGKPGKVVAQLMAFTW